MFETERLRVRRMEADDVDALCAVYGDVDAMRWVDDGGALDRASCERWIAVTLENYEKRGYGMSVLVERDGGQIVGFCGIVHPGGQDEPEIKYALRRECWGHGFATEAVRGMIAHGRDSLGIRRMIATVDPENLASQRVLEKAGMSLEDRRDTLVFGTGWILETPRLRLREMAPADAPFAVELNADPDVMRFTGDPPFASVEAASEFLRAYADYRRNGMGRWLMVRREDGAKLGWCGLKRHDNGDVDVGYRLIRRYWGHGYATEACRACIDYGLLQLGLTRIIAQVMVHNAASIRVIEKSGMQFVREELFDAHPGLLYEVCR